MVQLRLGAVAMLALLAWGCQEPGSSPVEPEGPGILLDKDGNSHPHGGGSGDGPGSELKVTITVDLVVVASEQTVRNNSDNKKKFVIGAPAFNGAINLPNTRGDPDDPPGDCVYSAGDSPALSERHLFDLLDEEPLDFLDREFLMFFDRSDEAGFNQIVYRWDDGQLRLYIGRVPNKGDRIEETVAIEAPERTFTFSAGEVRLFSGFGDQSSDIRCRLEDVVILVVT